MEYSFEPMAWYKPKILQAFSFVYQLAHKGKFSFFFLVVLTNPLLVSGQYKLNSSTWYGVEDGLPSKEIRGIQKGLDGFLWVATHNGLCRFDGSQFKVFQNDPADSKSLLDNRTLCLLVTDEKVWVGTATGVTVLDLKTEKFSNYQIGKNGKTDPLEFERASEIYTIFQDRQGEIWIGTRYLGAFKFDPKSDDFIPYRYSGPIDHTLFPDVEGVHRIRSFVQTPDNDSTLWVGSHSGLLEINKINGKISLHTFPITDKWARANFNKFLKMAYHKGHIYIGGYDSKIRKFDPKTKELEEVLIPDGPWMEVFQKGGLSTFLRKNKEELWISRVGGLVSYNPNLNKITSWKINDIKKNIFYSANESDEDYRIWGINHSHSKGFLVFDPFLQQYEPYSYAHLNEIGWGFAFAIVQHPDNNKITVFPRNADGLFHLDKKTKQWEKTNFPHKPGLEKVYGGLCEMTIDPNDNITFASQYGLFTYDISQRKIVSFPYQPKLNHNQIAKILWDSEGYFWVNARDDGLLRWDPKTRTERRFTHELKVTDQSVSIHVADAIFEDSKQNIWMRRDVGCSVYLREKDTIINFHHAILPERSFKFTTNFTEDTQGRIWTSSEENWIGYANVNRPEEGFIQKFNLSDLGVNGWTDQIRADLQGKLWITNSEALLEFDPNHMEIIKHRREYGQKDAENFNFEVLPTGELIFGERNHVIIAEPDQLKQNTELPIPYLTELKVLNDPYPIDTAIFYKRYLELNHNENFFSIGFSAQSYRLGNQTRFRYRLKNFEEWIDAGDRYFANYTNVPSGSYTFQLQAANNEGIWNEAIHELFINIATPWWATWWFRTLLIFISGGLVYMVYRYQLIQIEQRERIKTVFNKKLANVEMTALLAQMNPHFLFNCLNSIDSYILKNESRKASEYLNNFARLIRLILQNSRSNYISLKDELETLELYIQMESLRLKDKFKYEICIDENIEISSIDIPPMLIQPYVENAIWHGLMNKKNREEGLLSIHLLQKEGRLHCIIKDNGVGREKAQALKSKLNSTKKKSMGMSITNDRIELINQLYQLNAKVIIEDLYNEEKEAEGTKVVLEIPY